VRCFARKSSLAAIVPATIRTVEKQKKFVILKAKDDLILSLQKDVMNKKLLFTLLACFFTHTPIQPCGLVFAPIFLAQWAFDPTSNNDAYVKLDITIPAKVGTTIFLSGLFTATMMGLDGACDFITEALKHKPDSTKTRRYAKKVLLAAGLAIATPFAAIAGGKITSRIVNYRRPIPTSSQGHRLGRRP
jgi:hypothetical protein